MGVGCWMILTAAPPLLGARGAFVRRTYSILITYSGISSSPWGAWVNTRACFVYTSPPPE